MLPREHLEDSFQKSDQSQSSAGETLVQLLPDLYLFRDTCNVYLLRDGQQAVLIDFGSGAILKRLPEMAVEQVTDVLITHHHRDQCQGLSLAVKAGARIWVPHAEQDLFCKVDAHWQAREIFNNYNSRLDRFSLLEPVPITGTLADYAVQEFAGKRFTVIPTPGHTPGSLSLMAEMDGQRVAFTGDLIFEPGKVWSIAATQWTYSGAEGVAMSIPSLLDLKARHPDLLFPSHGDPILSPDPAIDMLVERFWALLQARGQNKKLFQWLEAPYEMVTPHLLRNRTGLANSYVLISKSGKALLIDYGYDFVAGPAPGADRAAHRPWLYTISTLKSDYGITQIDAVIATHFHDDHVAGFNLLREVEGAQVWAAENFADILENPARFDLPCLWYDPIPVDRRLALDASFQWEEYQLTVHALPGHTRYAAAVAFEIDGKRVLAVGDQYEGDEGLNWNYVYNSRFHYSDYCKSAACYRQWNPDLILSGHWEPIWVQPGYLDVIDEKARQLEQMHCSLLPVGSPDFGSEEIQMTIYPYQSVVSMNESIDLEVVVTNPFPQGEASWLRFIAPDGWQVDPSETNLYLDANETRFVRFWLTPPENTRIRRARVAVDLTIGGRHFGQLAEALVSVDK